MAHIAVISAKRPYQVSIMETVLSGMNPTWYVPVEQKEDYLKEGAKKVVGVEGVMPMKAKQLNQALNDGFALNETVVTMDDDYHAIKKTFEIEGKLVVKPYTLRLGIQELEDSLKDSPYHLAGVGVSLNAFFNGVGIKNHGKIHGNLCVHTPNVVRYDESVVGSEDTEYSLAHHAEHGGVVFHKSLLVDFDVFGRNPSKDKLYNGGYADCRNEETARMAAKIMSERYGLNIDGVEPGISRKNKIIWKKVAWVGKPSWL